MNKEKIIIPQEIQDLFDAAEKDDTLAVVFTKDSVQLINHREKGVIKEIKWDRVNDFARNFLSNVLEAQQ